MKKILFILSSLTILFANVHALNLMLGVSASNESIDIDDWNVPYKLDKIII